MKEFCTLAGQLRAWPERLLVHQFLVGLDKELRQACVYWGLPPRLSEWFRAAVDLDVGLQEFRPQGVGSSNQPRRAADKQPGPRGLGSDGPFPSHPTVSLGRGTFRCFRCNQLGHRAAECPMPPVQPSPSRAPVMGGKYGSRLNPPRNGLGWPHRLQPVTPVQQRRM